MIKKILSLILVLMFALPVYAEHEWRRRASSETDEVAASDIAEEVRFGREVAARILGRTGLFENDAVTRYVNLVGQSVALNSGRPEVEFHFAVLDTDEINGYAAPGGYVFVTKGALAAMKDESELAGVLAHEIAHVSGRHVVKELGIRGSEESAAAGLAHLIGGGSDSAKVAFFQAADKAMDILFKDGYKREDEAEADTNAAIFAALSGYDPFGLKNYLERVKGLKEVKTETLDKTHPPYAERIDRLKSVIEKEGLDKEGLKVNPERFLKETGALR